MRTYNIDFTQVVVLPDGGVSLMRDETQLDVEGNDPTELLMLFNDFVGENGFVIEPGSVSVEEVPHDGD